MARAKSTSSKGRASKTQTAGDLTGVTNASPVVATEAVAPAIQPAATQTEAKLEPKDAKLEIRPEAKMFEVRKTDPRKTVVPINLEEEIRRRAYELYLQRGSGSGNEAEDWANAEREIMQRYRQHSA